MRLARDTDGTVSFDPSVIERICEECGLQIEMFLDAPEDNVAALIIGLYQSHRQRGGGLDTVAEDLISEVAEEDRAGQSFSHRPGNA